nr:uncharacterized protein LOC127297463 isoform X1 [Lolium perenne]XP_051183730.1 uncharacterized protein LOC127297463 isoform X2 [Lolium perenne]XP_051183731.1 uncharacterized protein LOC127297463 isoform X3 [Lolium perenne]XP_051183732.1 uncharacterized protein LOC127297463 isoform X4 [Lolium perenne]XP_051183733.1 uncharacterized protein LOC127297463 isoform X5 [Lolium perenne]
MVDSAAVWPPPAFPMCSIASCKFACRSCSFLMDSFPAHSSSANSLPRFASSRISRRVGASYDEISGCPSASFNRYEDMFDEDDASKVTLPAWPGQGYGRHRLSSGLLVQFVSCPYSDIFDLLYDLDLMLYICILTRWSRCCNIYVLVGSIVILL